MSTTALITESINPETGEIVQRSNLPAAPQPLSFAEVLARVANDDAIRAQQQLVVAYDRACRALIGPNDIQRDGGREFKKKSAWLKLARYFGINTEIVSVYGSWETDEDGQRHYMAEATVRGVAAWGQTAEDIGVCTTRESRLKKPAQKSKADKHIRATAVTRARNRVISDLIAAGEVSAEEMEFGGATSVELPATTDQVARITDLMSDRRMDGRDRAAMIRRLERGMTAEAAEMAIEYLEELPEEAQGAA